MVVELKEFQTDTLRSFVENVQNPRNYRLASAFPDEQVFEDTFVFDLLSDTPVIASKVTGFDASSPIRTMGQAKQAMGHMTKIQDAFFIEETLKRKLYSPRRNTNERQVALDNAYMDIGNLAIGIDDTVEYLRSQLVYNGIVQYTDNFTQSKIQFEVDRPEGSNMGAEVPWSEDGADPFGDLKRAVKQYQTATNSRRLPERIDIAPDVEEALLNSRYVKEALYGEDTSMRLIGSVELQSLFTRAGLPPYYVNRDTVSFEDIVDDGTGRGIRQIVNKPYLDNGKVVLYDNYMGATARGSVEENGTFKFGKFVQPIQEVNPPRETVIVGEAVVPQLKAVNNNVIMNVL